MIVDDCLKFVMVIIYLWEGEGLKSNNDPPRKTCCCCVFLHIKQTTNWIVPTHQRLNLTKLEKFSSLFSHLNIFISLISSSLFFIFLSHLSLYLSFFNLPFQRLPSAFKPHLLPVDRWYMLLEYSQGWGTSLWEVA